MKFSSKRRIELCYTAPITTIKGILRPEYKSKYRYSFMTFCNVSSKIIGNLFFSNVEGLL